MSSAHSFVVVLASALAITAGGNQTATSQNTNLKIVVIAGEGSVNVIKQKTATAPVIEVRDRNNLPVPGAAVTFTIGGHSASFAGGAQALTVTTNAAGQAAAGALNPLSAGSFQIQVAASYQGQAAAATIAQSNIAAAAAAGGGISATTIGIVGAAVGGGAIVATTVAGAKEEPKDEPDPPHLTVYNGAFSGQIVITTISVSATGGGTVTCVSTRAVTGTMRMELQDTNGTLTGSASAEATQPEISRTGPPTCANGVAAPTPSWSFITSVTGTAANISFEQQKSTTGGTQGTNQGTQTLTFSGSLSGTGISGTVSYAQTLVGSGDLGSTFTENGSTTMPVTPR